MSTLAPTSSVETRTVAKIRRRILPFVFLLYIVAYLDRANVAFAKLPMQADLRFSEAVFGFGAGLFFVGYLLLEIPGALIVERWSARRWMARILISWGFCTVVVGFVRTPAQFYGARFLLGVAEAGFYPGIIIYLTHWFRRQDRARAMAGFIAAIPVSLVLGAPSSALILKVNWLGMAGWRWMFVLQGIPAILLGIVTLYYLTDHPREARWLEPAERDWITAELEAEKREKRKLGHVSLGSALRQWNVVKLALALCCANTLGFAYQLWLPTLIRENSNLSVGMATACAALPFGAALAATLLVGRSSDRRDEQRLHCAVPLLIGAISFALAGLPGQPFALVLLWLCLTGATTMAWPPPFWVLPTATLGESAAAASIGLINSIGNLGGFIGPTVVGFLLSQSYSMTTAILFMSSCYLVACALILSVRVRPKTR